MNKGNMFFLTLRETYGHFVRHIKKTRKVYFISKQKINFNNSQ